MNRRKYGVALILTLVVTFFLMVLLGASANKPTTLASPDCTTPGRSWRPTSTGVQAGFPRAPEMRLIRPAIRRSLWSFTGRQPIRANFPI